jgi:hypothetical protein
MHVLSVGISCALLCLTGVVCAAPADTLYLKDGGVRVGKITGRDSAYTTIHTSHDNLVISNAEIARTAKEQVRLLPMPPFGVHLDAGYASPLQFDFPASYGMRLGARWLLMPTLGVRATFSYSQWQINYDTVIISGNIKDPHPPVTHTFSVSAVSPRAGLFVVSRLAPTTQLLLGFDLGATFLGASGTDTSAAGQQSFSYALRGDVRFAIADHIGLLVGVQYEGYRTTWNSLQAHAVSEGARHGIGDLLVAVGLELGF